MLERVTTIEVQPIIINITVLGGEVSDQYNTGGKRVSMLVDGKMTLSTLQEPNTTWMMFKTNDPAIATRLLPSHRPMTHRISDPKDWTFGASSDGQNWVTLDQRSNIARSGTSHKPSSADNNELYQYYRLRVTKNNGATMYFSLQSGHCLDLNLNRFIYYIKIRDSF